MKDLIKENLDKNEDENKKDEKEKENEVKEIKEEKKETENKEENKKQEKQEEKATNEETKFTKMKKEDKKARKEMDKNKKKKLVTIALILGVITIFVLFFSTIFALVNINNNKITSGISISGIDVSGLQKEEALAKLQNIYQEKKEKEVNIKYQDYETSLNPTVMEINYDVEKAVEQAHSYGKENNIFVNNFEIIYALIAKKNVNVDMTLNEDVTKQTIEDIGTNLPGIIIESSYSIEEDDSEMIITKGKEGVYIDTQTLLNKVKENLNNINSNQDYIEIPVINKVPEEINIDKIHEEVYREAKDAYYTKDPFAVYPEVNGIDFDVEAARMILQENKEEYIIPLTITKPKITIDKIGSEAFPDQLATFTTRYDVSDVDRTTNLRLACQKINGKVVLAGETFSYNKTLGARTSAAGYKNAKIYEAGEVVDGLGGGICQISSTLYNAVLMSNLEIVERRNHQFVTSYVPAGRDATVVYGATDFRFKNTRQLPIRIVASCQNGIATVSIYGIKEAEEYTFSFSTKTIASIPFSTKYIEDATIASGTEKVKQKGANGLKTETYITKMLNGKVVSTKLLSRDTYDAMTRIIIKGTKGGVVTPQEQQTTSVTSEPVVETPQVETTPAEQTPQTPSNTTNKTEENTGN